MQISKDKIAHMHGVAEFMFAHAEEYGLKHHEDEMYVLGLLHDIGCVKGDHEGHAEYGKRLISDIFKDKYFAEYIEDHELTPAEYKERYHCNDKGIPYVLILLWAADLSVDSKGNIVGFEQRLVDISDRYGADSETFIKCFETVEWLKNTGIGLCVRN